MNSVAALITCTGKAGESLTVQSLRSCDAISRSILAGTPQVTQSFPGQETLAIDSLWSKQDILAALTWFQATGAQHLLWLGPGAPILHPAGLQRLLNCAGDSGAAIVYSDYSEQEKDGTVRLHPLVDYQSGSVRDDFDFGPAMLFNAGCLAGLAQEIGSTTNDLQFGGLYDLRLRLAERGAVHRLPEPAYLVPAQSEENEIESHFKYVDPRNRDYQIEMEKVATAHLRRIGAFLEPPDAAPLPDDCDYGAKASVIIPVRNRVRTISDAVRSALSQETSFDFNVLVVDNHSTDGTTELLAEIASTDPRLLYWTPDRLDLGIGGCWQEAIMSRHCGRFAVQLDSDDLYNGTSAAQKIVDEFEHGAYSVVIGSYTTVNFDLEELPPGLIDHREWTDANGHNNALRIAGLGAPRAFHVPTLRSVGFANVSYGEDYAVALRLSRTYRVGRIYESLYWCRRWEDNTDSSLSLEMSNRYALYKDRVRTIEIAARQRQNNA